MSNSDIISRLKEARDVIDECLSALSTGNKSIGKRVVKEAPKKSTKIDFSLNERNFIRTYGNGLSGPKKFVLLLAREIKGKVDIEVKLETLRTKWNKMTSKALMGYKFNLFYPNDAKTRGWIDSKKAGSYHLCDTWMEIFN